MKTANRILICYVIRGGLGLSNKVRTLRRGFEHAGCEVTQLIFDANDRGFRRLREWLRIHSECLVSMLFGRHDLIFVRYTYQFLPIFVAARLFRINVQLELNSDHRQEFILKNQIIRRLIDALAFRLALNAATSVHVVSQELIDRFRVISPTSHFIYNPNYVVDEYFSQQKRLRDEDRVHLVFLGDTTQPWQGIPQFVARVLSQNSWAQKHTKLHIVGRTSTELEETIATHGLQNIVCCHGYMSGAEKATFMSQMDIGIGVFNLGAKCMHETTSIKVGEYLFAGLSVIIGYIDLSMPEESPFMLRIDLQSPDDCASSVNDFIKYVRDHENLRMDAHEYAVQNLHVGNYVRKVLSTEGYGR